MKSWIDFRARGRAAARVRGALLLSMGLHGAFLIWLSGAGGLPAASPPQASESAPLEVLLRPLPDGARAAARQTDIPASAGGGAARRGKPDGTGSGAAVAANAQKAAPLAELEYLPARMLDARPVPREPVILPFPEAALDKPRATALLRLYVGRDGSVDRVEIEASDLPPEFELAAVEIFRQARMHPGMKDGRQVRALMKILVEYEAR